MLPYDGEEVLCGAQPSKKKSSFRFSFRSPTHRLSRRLPWETIKLAIVECERLDGTFETSLYVFFFNPRALFPAFIAVLSKYHANKTSNWIIQFSRFDLKNIPFALFRLQNQIRKTKKRLLIVFSDFVLNRNIQRTNHTRIM